MITTYLDIFTGKELKQWLVRIGAWQKTTYDVEEMRYVTPGGNCSYMMYFLVAEDLTREQLKQWLEDSDRESHHYIITKYEDYKITTMIVEAFLDSE